MPISSPNIAHSAQMHGTLRNVIFTSLIGWEIDVIDTLRFNNDAGFLCRLATALGIPPNREYWWSTKQPQVTDLRWQLGFHCHRRDIELVFKSLDYFTKRLFHTATFFCCYICILLFETLPCWLQGWRVFFSFFSFLNLGRFGGGALSSNAFAPYTDL